MKRPHLRALQGLMLSIGSPLGWLLIQWSLGNNAWLDLQFNPGVYAYMLFGSAFAFCGFGWYVGWQEEHFRDTSLHDELTGLYNTRYFWRRLEDECAFAARHRRPLSLLVGDIDHFKKVNDNHGHAAGNDVLKAIGTAMIGLRRRGDTIARVGGEEFAVILPETDLKEAVQVAERLRKATAELQFQPDQSDTPPFRVTLSFGAVCAVPDQQLDATTLFKHADEAMYAAKRAGRDRVETHGDGPGHGAGAPASA